MTFDADFKAYPSSCSRRFPLYFRGGDITLYCDTELRERSHGPQSRVLLERVARTYFRLTARNPLDATPSMPAASSE